MKKPILIAIALSVFATPASSIPIDPVLTILEVVNALKEIFGDEAPEPTINVDNNPCSVVLLINNLRGPYGNYEYHAPNIHWNDYWKGSLHINAAEGFRQKDRLEISGTMQHRDESCHPREGEHPGPPLDFLFNLDLNNDAVANKVTDLGQITLTSPNMEFPHLDHKDALTEATLRANIFDNKTEIGQAHLRVRAIHTPDSVTTFTILSFTLGIAIFVRRRKCFSANAH